MTPIVVLGMHRSGTSAVARVLNRMGIWLGSDENLSRRWEHLLVQAANEEILGALGGHWSAPPELDQGWADDPALRSVESTSSKALHDLAARPAYAWKDPRTCLTFGYWRARLTEEPVIVLVYRHPIEVADSLQRRDGLRPAHSLALWERHNSGALAAADGRRTVVVPYSDLVADPQAVAASIYGALRRFDIPLANPAAEAVAEIDPDRRHHVSPDSMPDDLVTASQRKLWSLLRSLPTVSDRLRIEAPGTPAPHAASAELLRALAQLHRRSSEARLLTERAGSRRALLRQFVRRNADELRRRRSPR